MDVAGYLPHFARSPAGVHNTMHAYAVFMPGVRGRYKTMPVRRFGGSMHATAVDEWEYDALRQETNAENASTLLLFDNETGIVRSVGLPAAAHAKDGMQATEETQGQASRRLLSSGCTAGQYRKNSVP